MATLGAADYELIVTRTFAEIREQFERALDDTSEMGNVLLVHGRQLRVDQVRRFVVDLAAGDSWTIRDGKRCLTSANEVQRAELSLYVGRNRFLTASQVWLTLCDLVMDKLPRATESQEASLVNLLVVEPMFHPERELPIWLTIARAFVRGHEDDDLYDTLPDVSSAFDVLYAELPATGEYANKVKPRPERLGAIPWPVYEMKLLAEIRPELTGAIADATDDAAREALWEAHTGELRDYIRARFFVAMAEAIAAAGTTYAEIPWDPVD